MGVEIWNYGCGVNIKQDLFYLRCLLKFMVCVKTLIFADWKASGCLGI